MNFLSVYLQILILFIVMFLGVILRKKEILSDSGIGELSSLIFYVTLPALVIYAITNTKITDNTVLYSMLVATPITYAFLIAVSFLTPFIFFVKKGQRGIYSFFTVFANTAFIGYPMLTAILGKDSVFFGAIFNIPFNLLLYTLGIYFILSDNEEKTGEKFTLKKIINPGLFATLFGVVLFVLKIDLPYVLNASLQLVGSMTTPLAMLIIGASLYKINIRELFKNYKVIIFAIVKMLTFPVIVGLFLKAINIDDYVIKVCMILVGMPIGTNTVIVARKYKTNIVLASEAVFISTVLMLLTSPVLLYTINHIIK